MTGCPSLEGHMVYVEQVCVGLGPALNLAHVFISLYRLCKKFIAIFLVLYFKWFRGEEVGSV